MYINDPPSSNFPLFTPHTSNPPPYQCPALLLQLFAGWSGRKPEFTSCMAKYKGKLFRARICKRIWSPGIDSASPMYPGGPVQQIGLSPGWESIPGVLKMLTNTGSVHDITVCTIWNTGSSNRLAMATFWRTFHHDGKFSPAWWGWGVHAPFPFHSIYHARSGWEGRYTPPISPLPFSPLWYEQIKSKVRFICDLGTYLLSHLNTLCAVHHQTGSRVMLCTFPMCETSIIRENKNEETNKGGCQISCTVQ
jgi:hypothetical protein